MNKDYLTLEKCYEVFNKKFFESKLPSCIITLQRRNNCAGYFAPQRFVGKVKKSNVIDEIALNPDAFGRTDKEILSTLAHEMVHLWQAHFGLKQSRMAYHNKEWGNKMEEIGLVPSHNGAVDGKKTGQKMTHYIAKEGPFAVLVKEITGKYRIEWQSRVDLEGSKKKKVDSSKRKFVCPECEQKAWAKETAHLVCGDCEVEMEMGD
jgi:predicted SprT family Zn-dependent metalloprotease